MFSFLVADSCLNQLAKYGAELTCLFLLESPRFDTSTTTFVGDGECYVEKISYSNEAVWIDHAKSRGFVGVPEEVWDFEVGGYQVCEKWLKDRQAKGGKNPRPGRVLTDEDIDHYQKIVTALSQTIRIMSEIDEVIDKHGGWPAAFVTTKNKASSAETQSFPFDDAVDKRGPSRVFTGATIKLPSTRSDLRSMRTRRKNQKKESDVGTGDAFDLDDTSAALSMVRAIVNGEVGEAGIPQDELVLRLAKAGGYTRVSAKIRGRATGIIRTSVRRGIVRIDGDVIIPDCNHVSEYPKDLLDSLGVGRRREELDRHRGCAAIRRELPGIRPPRQADSA